MSTTYLALLRGINVGGNCSLPMRVLSDLFAAAGATNVRTYIQSGNVVFRAANPEAASACIAETTRAIAAQFGYPGRIVLRSAAELHDVLIHNPFVAADAPIPKLNVYFLADQPAPDDVKLLDPNRSAPDAFVVRGREIFLHLPNGMARTKLTNAYFDSRLKTVSTARNWNTVVKLAAMAAE